MYTFNKLIDYIFKKLYFFVIQCLDILIQNPLELY